MIDEWKISKIGSFDRIANIRHGLDTKKLKRLSTIWALGPPMRIRAATISDSDYDADDAEAFHRI